MIDIKTGQRKNLNLSIKASSELFLTKDGDGFYFLGEKGKEDNERGIYYYDLKTHEVESIFLQKQGFINNFILLSEPIKE